MEQTNSYSNYTLDTCMTLYEKYGVTVIIEDGNITKLVRSENAE